MMKKLCFIFFLYAIVVAEVVDPDEVFHAANNKFTANMFSEIVQINPGKSLVFSAFSVITPLAQMALASVGPSRDELLESIRLSDANTIKTVFSHLDSKVRSIQGIELKTPSRIYIPLKYNLNPEFSAISRDVFKSEIKNVDFTNNVETANEINAWVENQTNHRIKDLVNPDSLDASTRAVLVNAIYFKGSWLIPFEKSETTDGDFYVKKEKVIKIPMMHNYKYKESKIMESKVLEMSYVEEQSSMIIILPNEKDGIDDLLEKLRDPSVLDEETSNLPIASVNVFIPKFKIETTLDLKQVLQKMNVTKIFVPGEARLDNLLKSPEDLSIGSATQKAFLDVNENGSEAAAANRFLGIRSLSAESQFVADHPFVFLLKERNNILFSGIYYI